jgi:hypothetical protein
VVGLVGGFALHQRALPEDEELVDAREVIAVTVPRAWTAAVHEGPWTPPGSASPFAALSAGTQAGWNGAQDPGHGVFVGVMRGDDLPTRVPQHRECTDADDVIEDVQDGDRSMTVFFTGCTLAGRDDGVTVERVRRATARQLLWVQVRAEDRATANRVLRTVTLAGS